MTLVDAPPIFLAGELDFATTANLLTRDDLRHLGGVMTIDMSDVTFVDAAALGAIVHLRNNVIAAGGTLVLAAVSAYISNVFTVAGLVAIL